MWFLGAVVTFGVAFFPMFYRLVDGRNRHIKHQIQLEAQLSEYLKHHGKEPLSQGNQLKPRNATLWASSIILFVPIFIIIYLLTKDLAMHEHHEDTLLMASLPSRVFMPQNIPQTTYALITIVTLGVGGVYWLYKLVNLYNAHYKADLQVEKEIMRLTEEEKAVEHM